MALPRFFVSQLPASADTGQQVSLSLEEGTLRHLQVLRMREGEHLVLVDREGSAFEYVFHALDGNCLVLGPYAPVPAPRLPHVTLVQGVSKGERMDQVVRQCTELGLERIIPLLSKRCVVKLSGDKLESRRSRWERIARSAAEQADLAWVPTIGLPLELDRALASLSDQDLLICAWEESGTGCLRDCLAGLPPDPKVALFIGPEGGFAPEEVEAMKAAGARVITLGDTILRTETAGVVASALLSYELGGLGNTASLPRERP